MKPVGKTKPAQHSAWLVLVWLFSIAVAHASGLLTVNFKKLISRADLNYDTPATRSEEGMPVGNGRMGSLVWTSPSALKFQINRLDVFGADSNTVSFPQTDSDYAAGCGYGDINLVDASEDVFAGKSLAQLKRAVL